jgi:hypothetical protein
MQKGRPQARETWSEKERYLAFELLGNSIQTCGESFAMLGWWESGERFVKSQRIFNTDSLPFRLAAVTPPP